LPDLLFAGQRRLPVTRSAPLVDANGHAKQGASFGHTKVAGKGILHWAGLRRGRRADITHTLLQID
jgi:hypothetical protein